jgi:hypothetical protein
MGGVAFRDFPATLRPSPDGPVSARGTTPEEREQQARFLAALPAWVAEGKPQEALLAALEISRTRLVAWLRDDVDFARAYDDAWRTLLRHEIVGIVVAMVRQAEAGDVQAARVCLELAGVLQAAKYRVDLTQTITLESVLHDSRRLLEARVVGERELPGDGRTPALAAALEEGNGHVSEHEQPKGGA